MGNRFLTPQLRRLLCNSLIQPHFDYALSAWYMNLDKGYKEKLNVMQRKCIRFCLMKDSRSTIGLKDFVDINWLPVERRANLINASLVYKFFNKSSPSYMNYVFTPISQYGVTKEKNFQRLAVPSRKTEMGKRTLSFLGPTLWNPLPKDLKKCSNINSFKHALKSHYFDLMNASDRDIYVYY